MKRFMTTVLVTVAALAAGALATGVAYAFNPQPDPPKAFVLCEATATGEIVVIAIDGPGFSDSDREFLGMSCMDLLAMAGRRGLMFDLNWFVNGTGIAMLGIIITGGKPAEF